MSEVLNVQRIRNLQRFRALISTALQNIIKNTSDSNLRRLYEGVNTNLRSLPITFYDKTSLHTDGEFETQGENLKRWGFRNGRPYLESKINLPANHIFIGNEISTDGALTMLHELAHVVLPENAHRFGESFGLRGELVDEFFADVLAARIAYRMGVSKRKIAEHLIRRVGVYRGFPIHTFVEEGYRPRESESYGIRRRRIEEPVLPSRSPEPQSFFPRRERGLGIFDPKNIGRAKII